MNEKVKTENILQGRESNLDALALYKSAFLLSHLRRLLLQLQTGGIDGSTESKVSWSFQQGCIGLLCNPHFDLSLSSLSNVTSSQPKFFNIYSSTARQPPRAWPTGTTSRLSFCMAYSGFFRVARGRLTDSPSLLAPPFCDTHNPKRSHPRKDS